MTVRFLLAALLALMAGACANGPRFAPGQHLTLLPDQALPAPEGADGDAYRIGAFDKLSISVFNVPDLTQVVQVDASGRIALPLIGSMEVAGSTPVEVSEAIEERLRGRYLRDPQAAVNVDETVSHVVTVEGQVREPGVYPVLGQMTLLRAIASARGTTEFARVDDVVIFRSVGDRNLAALYNLGAIRRGTYPDPAVYANDVVVIGDSPGRRLFRDFLQTAPLLTTPIIALLQR